MIKLTCKHHLCVWSCKRLTMMGVRSASRRHYREAGDGHDVKMDINSWVSPYPALMVLSGLIGALIMYLIMR